MTLPEVANETVRIASDGHYTLPSGERVSIAQAVAKAVSGTKLYRPDDYAGLTLPAEARRAEKTFIEVTGETTAEAARRLVEEDGFAHVAALNFASAKNPGGGFLRGAKAQEEDLARCSALYACLVTQRGYYDENRACASMLYTDHLIYSPDVPFFRDERLELLPKPFVVSVITSPAPNAGEELQRDAGAGPRVRTTLARRAEQVLRVCARHGHRALVLGAWGCGVFKNDPCVVAEVFAKCLSGPPFERAFERVVFAVYDTSKEQRNRRAFDEQFGSRS